jgi:signal transduction histidine kinase/ActR/RegA family two-component response regulator
MNELAELVLSHENWLMQRVLQYAKEHEYTKYTSTLAEAWRTSIAGLSEALVQGLEFHGGPPQFGPDEDFTKDPIASFGILEAQLHRARGVRLGMFLGLMKYYRQGYIDLVLDAGFERDVEERHRLFVDRFFDRLELGFTVEWVERSQSELTDELQASNRSMTNEKNRYLTVFESLANPVILLNDRSEIQNMNYAALLLFTGQETPGGYYYRCQRRLQTPAWLSHDAAEFAGKDATETVLARDLQTTNGLRHFEVRLTRMLDVSGKFSGTIVVLNDLTEHRHVQDALQASEAQKEAILNGIGTNIAFVNENLEVIWANKACVDSAAGGHSQLTGRRCHELWADPEKPCDGCPTVKALRSKKPEHARMETPDGRVWDESGEPVFDAEGRLIGVVEIARDITELVRAEEERERLRSDLIQAQKMQAIGTLTGGIAHNFNNLLTVVLGYSELLLGDTPEGDPTYADLEKICRTCREGADLIQRLLTFSQRAEAQPQRLNLNDRIRQLHELLRKTIPLMVKIKLVLADDLASIDVDPNHMEQIVMNLAVNASDAMPEGGVLTVETRNAALGEEFFRTHREAKPGMYVLLRVSDTGRGIDKETIARMFEPFFTTKGWDSRRGTGLGLSIVQGVVEKHGGYIECFSELDKGTTFDIYLPVKQGPVTLTRATEEPALPEGPQTILFVDDEEYIRELGQRCLSRAGYTVIVAGNGAEAIERYDREKGKIALIVLDLIMPETSGRQCLQHILSADPQARILIASGQSSGGAIKNAMQMGAKGYLGKPYDMKQLLRAVTDAFTAP